MVKRVQICSHSTEKCICIYIIIKNIKKCQSTSLEKSLNYLSSLSIENDIVKHYYIRRHQDSMQEKSYERQAAGC